MYIYALIGPSGTGKSYRALKVAYEKDIRYIIDDGILIHQNKIIAGISAKKANTKMEAVRRAIYEDVNHRNSVKDAIIKNNIDKLLIIGTSKKMIKTIMEKLSLGSEYEEISIYDIATEQEINEAKEIRMKKGIHIIPLPTFEVKKHFPGIFIETIKLFFKTKNSQVEEVEKTIIRPNFSYMGKYFISEKAIRQIVLYEVNSVYEVNKIYSINVKNQKSQVEINIGLGVNLDNIENNNLMDICKKIQKNILISLETMTLLNITGINIQLIKFYQNK